MVSEEELLNEQLSALLEKVQSGDAIQGVSFGSMRHAYKSTTVYDDYLKYYHGKGRCQLSAFVTDKDNPNSPKKLNGLILKAEDGKFLVANGYKEPQWHDTANFHFEKPFKADLTFVSIEKSIADKIDDESLAAAVTNVHEANEAKKQLKDIIGNLEEDVRNSIYEAHSELDRFVPRHMFKEHEEHR
ncbi:MAG: hypothetical protein V4568_17880 [Pseudomonadota bacterium]